MTQSLVIGAMIVLVLIILFSTKNFIRDLICIVSCIFQEIIRLGVAAVGLFFRLISIAELYLILLCDIFSGNLKTNSISRLLSISLVALSAASFYTTFHGMGYLLPDSANSIVRACITFGIQAIMLGSSLLIGKNSIIRSNDVEMQTSSEVCKDGFPQGKNLLRVIVIFFAAASFLIVYFLRMDRKLTTFLYLLGCGAVVVCLLSLLPGIFANSHRGRRGVILLCVYFSTLCVSSFFSYQTLLNTLYQESERKADNLSLIAQELTAMVEDASSCFDENYQTTVQARLVDAVDHLKAAMESETNYGAGELADVMEYEAFLRNYSRIRRLVEEYYDPTTTAVRKMDIEYFIRTTLGGPMPNGTVASIETCRKIIAYYDAKDDCTESIEALSSCLQKLSWDASDTEKSEKSFEDIAGFLGKYISVEERTQIDPYLRDISALMSVTASWKQFLNESRSMQQSILELDTTAEHLDWDESIRSLLEQAQVLLKVTPVHFPSFATYSDTGELTGYLSASDRPVSAAELSIQLQKVIRNHRPTLNDIEKNLTAFVDAPLVSLFAALIAVLMDTLILFVGMLLPKPIPYFKDIVDQDGDNAKYSPEEINENLGNLFNKPVTEKSE